MAEDTRKLHVLTIEGFNKNGFMKGLMKSLAFIGKMNKKNP